MEVKSACVFIALVWVSNLSAHTIHREAVKMMLDPTDSYRFMTRGTKTRTDNSPHDTGVKGDGITAPNNESNNRSSKNLTDLAHTLAANATNDDKDDAVLPTDIVDVTHNGSPTGNSAAHAPEERENVGLMVSVVIGFIGLLIGVVVLVAYLKIRWRSPARDQEVEMQMNPLTLSSMSSGHPDFFPPSAYY